RRLRSFVLPTTEPRISALESHSWHHVCGRLSRPGNAHWPPIRAMPVFGSRQFDEQCASFRSGVRWHSSCTERGARLLDPSRRVHLFEEAEGALDHRTIFPSIITTTKAAIGEQRLG